MSRITSTVMRVAGFLSLACGLWLSAQPGGQPHASSEQAHRQVTQIAVLSEHLSLNDRHLDYFLRDVGFVPPAQLKQSWAYYPDYRKVIVATSMAQHADPTAGADRFLAMLASSLSQRGDAIPDSITRSKISTIPFKALPTDSDVKAVLTLQQITKVRALSKFLDSGSLGTPQAVMVRYAKLTFDQAFDILETSDSNVEAFARAIATVAPTERDNVIKRMAHDAAAVYPAVRHEEKLAALFAAGSNGDIFGPDGPGFGFRGSGPSPAGGGGGGIPKAPTGGGPTAADARDAFNEAYSSAYPGQSDRQFKSMRRNPKGLGGIIFGSSVVGSASFGKVAALSYRSDPGSEYGSLYVRFDSGASAVMKKVKKEEALVAYDLIYGTAGWSPGDGVGLVGLTYECRKTQRTTGVKSTPEEDHQRVILNPVLRNTSLGWSLIAVDGRPRHPKAIALGVQHGSEPTVGVATAQTLYGDVVHTFTMIRYLGWKVTDVPLRLEVHSGQVALIRSDASDDFPEGLLRSAYIEMTPYTYLSKEDQTKEKATFLEGFSERFYTVLPLLTSSLPEYQQVNHFAAVLALVRRAKADQASFSAPDRATLIAVKTPEFVKFTDKGVYPDETPICSIAKLGP